MYRHDNIIMVDSKKDEWLDADLSWQQNESWAQACKGCGSPKPEHYPEPLETVVQLRPRASLSLAHPLILVVHRRLFEALLPLAPELVPGPVRYADGRTLRDCVTVHAPVSHDVLLRGGRGSRERGAYGVCDLCERAHSSRAMFSKPWNVLRSNIPPSGDVYVTRNGMLFISEAITDRLDIAPFSDLFLRPIPVLDEPLEPVPEFGDA